MMLKASSPFRHMNLAIFCPEEKASAVQVDRCPAPSGSRTPDPEEEQEQEHDEHEAAPQGLHVVRMLGWVGQFDVHERGLKSPGPGGPRPTL